MRDQQPKFLHDCDKCAFLGHEDGHDLYYCGSLYPTVIARFSSEGPDYASGMIHADTIPLLGVAKKRAIERGLYRESR